MGKDPARMVIAKIQRARSLQRFGWLVWLAFFAFSISSIRLTAQSDTENLTDPGQPVEQPAPNPASAPGTLSEDTINVLATRQSELADRFSRLENLLLRMADFDQSENPHRAELLKKAFALSREKRLGDQFSKLASLLENEEYGTATDNQKILKGDLDLLLKMLLTEDQSDRNKSEQARLREYIKELERLGRLQRSLRGRTENRLEAELTDEQKQLADRAAELDQQIGDDESPALSQSGQDSQPTTDEKEPTEGRMPPKEGEPKDPDAEQESSPKSDSSEEKSGDNRASPGESPESKPSESDGDSAESEPKDSAPSEAAPSDSAPEKSPPQESAEGGKPGKPQPSSPSSEPPGNSAEKGSAEAQPAAQEPEQPARKQIRIAQEAMEEAAEQLKKAEQSKSVEEQRKAEAALAAAKAELERILRQLREEEIERVLTMLETRFRRMLEMQVEVHTGTQRLQESRAQGDNRVIEIEAGKLGFEERRIVAEADKALVLLRAEGSSVAFPETVEQMRMDMEQVADRLSRGLVESITQGLEEEIIATLEELLDALKQSQKEQEERKQSPPMESAGGEEDEQGLLDRIAELKMIKALQVRINKRTLRYAQLLKDFNDRVGQAEDPELKSALKKLAEREADVRRITREAVLGKNR